MYNYYPYYEFRNNNPQTLKDNSMNFSTPNLPEFYPEAQDERFFLAPFVVGGLAGTALGYGIANNNQINNGYGPYPQPMYFVPFSQPNNYPYPYMYSSNSNNYYY